MPRRKDARDATIHRSGQACQPCWRVCVTVRGNRRVNAVAHIVGVDTGDQAAAIVMQSWTKDDWDSEAFASVDRAGTWHYYCLRDSDEIVVERVEAAHDC